jgi:hypothetical protein
MRNVKIQLHPVRYIPLAIMVIIIWNLFILIIARSLPRTQQCKLNSECNCCVKDLLSVIVTSNVHLNVMARLKTHGTIREKV